MYLWKQFGISIQIRIVPYHPYNYLCSRVQNQCQMRHLASKAKYLASKSLALAHSGLVTGQGWKMQPTSFANSPFLPFHASDTNGLIPAKPVTCQPNWLPDYCCQQTVCFRKIKFLCRKYRNWAIRWIFTFPFSISLTFDCVSVSKSEVLNFDHVPTFPINVCPSPNADLVLPMLLSSGNKNNKNTNIRMTHFFKASPAPHPPSNANVSNCSALQTMELEV